MYEDAPPLKVWAFTALTAFVLLFLFLSYCYTGIGPYGKVLEESNSRLETALIENNIKDTSALSVVVIGSSLLERALADPKDVERAIAEKTQQPAKFFRLSVYYMSMNIAERMKFFEYIAKHPPDYLFIENIGINLDDPLGESLPTPIDAALLHLRNEFRSTTGLPTHENYYNRWYQFDHTPAATSSFFNFEFDSSMFEFLLTKRMIVRQVSENETANKAYAALKGKTKIFFLGMPQSNKLQPDFLDAEATAEFANVMKNYKENYDIGYWQYPAIMPDSCFSDGFHLNQPGAKKYQEWFVSQLASIE
jgi:hypothetical protein